MREPLLIAVSSFLLVAASSACRTERDTGATSAEAPLLTYTSAGSSSALPSSRRLLADVAWLADDAQEGRRAGTEAGARVAHWLAARLQELGLEPAGEAGTFLQELSVPKPIELGTKSRVGDFAGADQVTPLFCSAGGEAQGELAFQGYGILAADLGWNDYPARIDGKIAVVVRGTPKCAPPVLPEPAESAHGNVQAGDGWGNSGSLFLKVMSAKKNGAVAVLIVPHPSQRDEPLPPFDFSRAALASIPAFAVSYDVAKQLLGDYAVDVAATDAGQRPELALTELNAFASGALTVFADVVRAKGPAFNVLGRLKGARSQRCVLVGAHYDHLGLGGEGSLAPDAFGQVHNGADDNASGTAAVLELARLLAAGPKLDCDVVFALWTGEELGLLGSEHWAAQPTFALATVEANLNLDMVGRANGSIDVLGVGSAAPLEGWVRAAAEHAGLAAKIAPSGQGIGGSDHQSFLKRQIPSVHFFTGTHVDYHKPSDDLERFEAAGAAQVVALNVELVRELAAAGDLAWIEPPAPAASEKRGGSPFRVWFGTVPEYSYTGKGLLLAGTSAGSPAEKAGMLKGDVLVQVGDVAIEGMNDFMYALQLYKPGDVVLARFLRDGQEESARVTLATRDAQ